MSDPKPNTEPTPEAPAIVKRPHIPPAKTARAISEGVASTLDVTKMPIYGAVAERLLEAREEHGATAMILNLHALPALHVEMLRKHLSEVLGYEVTGEPAQLRIDWTKAGDKPFEPTDDPGPITTPGV